MSLDHLPARSTPSWPSPPTTSSRPQSSPHGCTNGFPGATSRHRCVHSSSRHLASALALLLDAWTSFSVPLVSRASRAWRWSRFLHPSAIPASTGPIGTVEMCGCRRTGKAGGWWSLARGSPTEWRPPSKSTRTTGDVVSGACSLEPASTWLSPVSRSSCRPRPVTRRRFVRFSPQDSYQWEPRCFSFEHDRQAVWPGADRRLGHRRPIALIPRVSRYILDPWPTR